MRRRTTTAVLIAALTLGGAPASAQESTPEPSFVSGTVTSEGGSALAGICVTAWTDSPAASSEPAGSARTDDAGNYSMQAPPGVLRVGFYDCNDLPAYGWGWWGGAALYSEAAAVTLEAGQQRGGINGALGVANTVTGNAEHSGLSQPLPGICAALFDQDFVLMRVGVTDENGDVELAGVRPGQHYLAWIDCNETPVYATQWHAYQRNYIDADLLDVAPPPAEVDEVQGWLLPTSAISGRVTDASDGQGVAEACVHAFDRDRVQHRVVATGEDGTYTLDRIGYGYYFVAVSDCAAQQRYGDRWFDAKSSFEQSTEVVVHPDETTSGIDVALTAHVDQPPASGSTGPGGDAAKACPDGEAPDGGFNDVPLDSIHKPSIDCVVWKGIASGKTSVRYAPADSVTRAQMATFLVRTMELVAPIPPSSDATFDDIASNPHAESIRKLASIGVVSGTGRRTYSPNRGVSRAQMATFLVRAYEYLQDGPLAAGSDRFRDDDGNAHEANINKAVNAGFTGGISSTRYAPLRTVRRDQMASFLARTLERLAADGMIGASASAQAAPAGATDELRAQGLDQDAEAGGVPWSPLELPVSASSGSGDGDTVGAAAYMVIGGNPISNYIFPPRPPATLDAIRCSANGSFTVETTVSNQGAYFVEQWHSRQRSDGTWGPWQGGTWVRLQGQLNASTDDTVNAHFTGLAAGRYLIWTRISYPDGRVMYNNQPRYYAQRRFNRYTGHYEWVWNDVCDTSSTGGS